MKTTANIFVFFILYFGHLLLTNQSDIRIETNKSNIIINGTYMNSTVRQVDGKPIVIQTQIEHYDQPTLRDYQECYENLTKCKIMCEGVNRPLDCVKQCPVCPVLIKEEIVVQGINDTDYSPRGPSSSINTTNIIRLTNEIHNIIKNQRGNITYNNDNLVNIYQNVSRVGGKFGLGYNNTDQCCIILSLSKSCKTKRFSTSANCHRKKHRVCSRKCKSRVMQAKRITVCENGMLLDENEDYIDKTCYETVKYVPYYNQKRHRFRLRSKCAPLPYWPYVKCIRKDVHYRQSVCRHCQSLTYQYVLLRGLPAQCFGCFMQRSSPNYEIYPMWQSSFSSHNINNGIDYEDDLDFEMNDWRNDRTLCRLPNGKISNDCNENDIISSESPPNLMDRSNTWEDVTSEDQDEYSQFINDNDYYYDDNYEQIARRKRHAYTSSKYSRKHI